MELTLEKPVAARVATAGLFFAMGAAFATWASRIPDIQEAMNLSAAQLGGVLIGMPVGSLSSLLVSGALVTRFGSRNLTVLIAVLHVAVLPFIALAPTTWQLTLALVLFGNCENLLNIALNTQGVGVETRWGKPILTSFHALWSLGAMTGAAVGGVLAGLGVPPARHFLLVGIAVAAAGVLAYRFMLPTDDQPGGQKGEKQPLFALPDRPLLLLGLICFACMLTEGAMADWSAIYYKQTLTSAGIATTGYTAFTLTMALGRFGGDWLTTRLGARAMLTWSGLLIAAGTSLALSLPTPPVVVAGFMGVGLGVATVVPLAYSAAGRSTTMSAGLALSAVSTVGYTGFLLGPPLIGFLAEASSLRGALLLLVALGFLIAGLARRVRA